MDLHRATHEARLTTRRGAPFHTDRGETLHTFNGRGRFGGSSLHRPTAISIISINGNNRYYFHKPCITEVKIYQEYSGANIGNQTTRTINAMEKTGKNGQSDTAIRKAVEVGLSLEGLKAEEEFAKANITDAAELERMGDTPIRRIFYGRLLNPFQDGSLKQKLWRFFLTFDLDHSKEYAGTFYNLGKEKLTEKETDQLRGEIRDEDVEMVRQCFREYNTINAYGGKLEASYYKLEVAFGRLALLINQWDGYENAAKIHTATYRRIRATDPEAGENYRDNIIICSGEDGNWNGARLQFNEKEDAFTVDVDGMEESLYGQIKEAAAITEAKLSAFKAFVVAAMVYLEKSILHYTPLCIVVTTASAMGNHFADGLVRDKRYFRQEINKKKIAGEKVTREEEKRAVIPDFYEVKTSLPVYKECLDGIKGLANGKYY